jgi:asparagine synthase (glutamine-hydrolysing)
MCGIFALLNNDGISDQFIQQQFDKGRHRGPEFSVLKDYGIKIKLGFHRLAINGLNSASNQPFQFGDIILVCNGEIYNYKTLYKRMGVVPTTDSDCEVIYHLYMRYGIEQTIQMLDGVFSIILFDQNSCGESAYLYIARDPYGVRPLYVMNSTVPKNRTVGFASELKMLADFEDVEIRQVQPGTYSKYELTSQVMANWKLVIPERPYHNIGFEDACHTGYSEGLGLHDCNETGNLDEIFHNISTRLTQAVYKRCMTTDRPIACLLSGGLDSSLITALVCQYQKIYGNNSRIETYSIGLAGSSDLDNAKIVAKYLGTHHTEVILTEAEFLAAIPQVIWDIESYDTTTVRASIGNYLLGKYISENSQAKVIFNGDGSDELAGGYLYMSKASDAIEFDRECRRLLKDIHLFDVLRSDKSISSHGLEPRTPFLDRGFVQYYMSISAITRFHVKSEEGERIQQEKYLIRNAFKNSKILPNEILFRRKEAFSDGVSTNTRSLYIIIREMTDQWFADKYDCPPSVENVELVFKNKIYKDNMNSPKTSEQMYYRTIFEEKYPGRSGILPYFWMPKYVNATDASARTLAIYNSK